MVMPRRPPGGEGHPHRRAPRQTFAVSSAAAPPGPRRHNLPPQATSFVGRQAELAEIQGLLSDTRLLTLTGAGGCGKTRLALQAAAECFELYTDGTRFVDLASASDPNQVVPAIAAAVGLREQPGRSLLETAIDYLQPRQVLLVMDNCEHLVEACAA